MKIYISVIPPGHSPEGGGTVGGGLWYSKFRKILKPKWPQSFE